VVLVIVSVLCNDEKGGLEKIINCMIEWFKKEKHDCGSKKRSVLAGRYYSNALCPFRARSDYFRFPPPIG
jgi:hypothetical protein